MKLKFIPIDYDYFDFQGKNYAKIIGRDDKDKRVCVIDSCDVFLWAILKKDISKQKIKKLIEKISKIKLDIKGRQTKVEKVELHEKKFLDKKVLALKIFATNYKDLHDIADKLNFNEIEKRRGYDLGYTTHYINEKKILPLQWYEIEGGVLANSQEFGGIDMALDVDYCINLKNSKKINEKNFKPKILCYDIETDDLQIGKGEILMISLVGENFKKVLSWKKSESEQKFVEHVKNEEELLEKFCEEIKKFKPDFLIGYFSDGFDLPYLKARAEKLKVKLELGVDGSQPKFSRGSLLTGKINGIVHIDLLRFIRTAYAQYMQSETLSLNEVAKEFLGDTKKQFKIEHSSKIKKWNDYHEYNLHDSVLVKNLFEKFWPDLQEFTKIVREPIFDVSRYGLSKIVESYILHNLERFNEIPEKRPTYNEISERKNSGGVEGAFVLEPKPGLYEDIAMFDFTSMHTSIIITHNISKGTLLNKKEKESYESPEIEFKNKKQKFYFSKQRGFFPELLNEIFEMRKKFKEEFKKNPNQITKARSNAFKVLSASVHGYIGFFGARYYSIESSASILAFVRKFNKETIEKIKTQGYEVIYGDSISGDTKIIIKDKNNLREEKIKDLFIKTDYKTNSGKEYNIKESLEVLTLDEKGMSVFKPIPYILRHKCNKKMYRVHFTNNWFIDVTEDHSLMGYQAYNFNQSKKNKLNPLNRIIEIKPDEIGKKVNSIITLKKIPLKEEKSDNYLKEIYELIGLFIGDGSFCRNKTQKKSDKDYYLSLSLGNDKEEILDKIIKPLIEKGYIKNYWESKIRKGDIKLNGLKLIKIITKNCRIKGKKTIPDKLFYETEENIASFLRGLFTADGTVIIRNKTPIIKYTSIEEDYIKKVRNLLYRLGISHSIFKENNKNVYKTYKKVYSSGSYSKNIIIKDKESFARKIGFILERKNQRMNIKTNNLKTSSIKEFEFDLQSVKKTEEIDIPEYVYDIEVEDTHKFFANNILAHNTDSIAFLKNGKSEEEIKKLLKRLNSELPGIMHLELEDFFKRGIWVTTRAGITGAKKKYALLDKKENLKIRGFETVRRDWCKLSRNLQNKIIKQILEDGNEKKALEILKDIVKKIKDRKISQEEIIIRTQLKKPLSEYIAKGPHVIAAEKMKKQEIPISQGGLIEYYIAETKEKKKLVREKVKLPNEEGEYDIEYYLTKQILPAVENIFHIFGIEIKEIIDGKRQDKLGKWF